MVRRFKLNAPDSVGIPDFGDELNAQQLAAVTAAEGPALVIAGAGSGKTRVLIYRIAWLLDNGVDFSRILLVTFTNRAAREMLQRVEVLLRHDVRHLWGGTFHHIANRVLRLYGKHIGIDPAFTILDREDAKSLLSTCVAELDIESGERRFPNKAVLASISSFQQNTLDSLENVLASRFPMFLQDVDLILQVLDLYAVKKAQGQLLDFDDLLSRWLLLLESCGEVREMLSERFAHILVDEYQDTNAIQGRIVDILGERHRNIFVVGDDSQSIYSFRGATFENILDFQKRFPDAQVYRLETNYRSTPEILELANQSIARNQRRLPKKLTSVRRQGLRPAFVACCDHYVQSRFIAQYILHLVEQGRSFNDIAVLYRSHWHSLDIQLELQRRNVPFQVRGGLRFFEQAHIKDVVAYLRILQNPRDQLAWMRILPHMPRVGAKTAQRVWQYISAACEPLLAAIQPEAAALLPRSVRPFYQRFCDLLQTLGSLQAPAEIMQAVIDDYYGEYLESHYEQARLRREDLNGIMTFAEQYKTLDAFLADVALSGEYSGENVAAGPLEREFVVLSTVHQAKGLEWPVVIIPWLADGRFPADLAMNADDEIEEERRVFHVAVTRAEDELYLVVPRTMQGRGQGRTVMKPSRFLTELGAGVMERLQLDEDIPDPRGSTFRAGGGRGGNPAHDCEPESHPDDLHYEYDDTPF